MYDVIVIGAGPAGCACASLLARRGLSVLMLEKKRYPVHKLCGEFLSGEAGAILQRLSLDAAVDAAGARRMRKVHLSTESGHSFSTKLQVPARGISRFALDALMLDGAEQAGVEARSGVSVREVAGSLVDGFDVSTTGETVRGRAVVGAFGKRSRLDGRLARPFMDKKSPRVAFKAHYQGLDLGETIELHTFEGGYCGLAPVEGGRVNICWLARQDMLERAGGRPEDMIDQVLRKNEELARRFDRLERQVETYSAVAQVSFAQKGLFSSDICMVGDAAAMIAPLCGDGMAMALRSGELAAYALGEFLTGHVTAVDMKGQYARAWRREFRGRLSVGRAIHAALSRPLLASLGVAACRVVPPLAQWLIRVTRG